MDKNTLDMDKHIQQIHPYATQYWKHLQHPRYGHPHWIWTYRHTMAMDTHNRYTLKHRSHEQSYLRYTHKHNRDTHTDSMKTTHRILDVDAHVIWTHTYLIHRHLYMGTHILDMDTHIPDTDTDTGINILTEHRHSNTGYGQRHTVYTDPLIGYLLTREGFGHQHT